MTTYRYLLDGEKTLPPLVPGRSLLSAVPRTDRFMACSIICESRPIPSFFPDGHLFSWVEAAVGMYHVMFNPFQHAVIPDAAYIAKDRYNIGPDTIFARLDALDPMEHPGAGILTAFWTGRGIPQNMAWGLQRIRSAKVLGQIAANGVSNTVRLHTDYGEYRITPGMFLVCEENGDYLRPMTRGMMRCEFSRVCKSDGTVVVDFDRPADPHIV